MNEAGESYTGAFKNRVANGYGVLTLSNGDVYKGQFKRDLFNGQGTYTYVGGHT